VVYVKLRKASSKIKACHREKKSEGGDANENKA
jgi:hypothetical protein